MAQIAAVAVDKATPQFDREYSYLVPDGLPVQVGCRVTVPFGRGNRRRLGLVLSLSESEDTARLKKIASLVDRQPLIGEEQLGLMRWLREHTFCSWFDAVRVLIPAGLGMDLEDQFLAEPARSFPPMPPRERRSCWRPSGPDRARPRSSWRRRPVRRTCTGCCGT